MTAPNQRVDVPSALADALRRIRILEASLVSCCPDWQDMPLDNEPYVECPNVGLCLQYAYNCCDDLVFQGMLRDGNDQPTADEEVGTLPAAAWPAVDLYTVIPFQMFNNDLVYAVLYVAAADGTVRVQWGN